MMNKFWFKTVWFILEHPEPTPTAFESITTLDYFIDNIGRYDCFDCNNLKHIPNWAAFFFNVSRTFLAFQITNSELNHLHCIYATRRLIILKMDYWTAFISQMRSRYKTNLIYQWIIAFRDVAAPWVTRMQRHILTLAEVLNQTFTKIPVLLMFTDQLRIVFTE